MKKLYVCVLLKNGDIFDTRVSFDIITVKHFINHSVDFNALQHYGKETVWLYNDHFEYHLTTKLV